jgi:hypothetical protein
MREEDLTASSLSQGSSRASALGSEFGRVIRRQRQRTAKQIEQSLFAFFVTTQGVNLTTLKRSTWGV